MWFTFKGLEGVAYFNAISYADEGSGPYFRDPSPSLYWDRLDEGDQIESSRLQTMLLNTIKVVANGIKHSSLLTEADQRDLSVWTKTLRSSLRLRRYETWDTEVLHDEGEVLGVKRAGQSDEDPLSPSRCAIVFKRTVESVIGLVDLLAASPLIAPTEAKKNPQAVAEFNANTAFVMMQIDHGNPALEDTYETIKECFRKYGINAIRADEIEHQDVITDQIINAIKTSEFLLADLTGERPSVYYEIGYAHCLNRRPIMFRKSGSNVHFDIAAYNCPEYENQTKLKEQLMKRLEALTNRKPKDE